jgi:hypothetical protein
MRNWKCLSDDNNLVCYCDIDSIIDPDADDDGIYTSVECYGSIPLKTASWMMYFVKNDEIISRYIEYRKVSGFSTDGYEAFNNFMSLVELDSEKNLYRVIPLDDLDSEGNRLDTSSIISRKSFIRGLKGEWSPILKGKTHKSIFALYKFIYGRAII